MYSHVFLPTGLGLLNNLRVQSETGFGSGVLTHVVLSGSESDKLHCALCLPLIIRYAQLSHEATFTSLRTVLFT